MILNELPGSISKPEEFKRGIVVAITVGMSGYISLSSVGNGS